MHTYELVFTDGHDDAVRKLQFDAEDASKALHVAHQQRGTRVMELWEDGAKLCELHRRQIGFDKLWVVSG